MPLLYTAEQLIRSIGLKNPIASVGSTGSTDSDLLLLINEAIFTYLVPKIIKQSEEFFTIRERVSIGSNNAVRIPHRAMFQKIRHIYLYGPSGRTHLNEVQKENLEQAGSGYYFDGNDIIIHPEAQPGLSELELHYFFRPGEMVKSTECRQITGVDYDTNTVQTDPALEYPESWTTDLLYDIHSGKSGAEIELFDLAPDSIDGPGGEMVFPVALDGSLFGTRPVLVGDWLCLAEEAALPGLPRELHPQIARAVAILMAEGVKDEAAIKISGGILKGALDEVAGVLDQRTEGKPKKITGRGGILWAGRKRWF